MPTHTIFNERPESQDRALKVLEKLGRVMSTSSLCGLGQAAPAPVLSTIKHYPADYNAKFV